MKTTCHPSALLLPLLTVAVAAQGPAQSQAQAQAQVQVQAERPSPKHYIRGTEVRMPSADRRAPLKLVGLEESGSDFRQRTPALAQGTLSSASLDPEALRQQRLVGYGAAAPIDLGPVEAPEPAVAPPRAEPVTPVAERLHSFRLVTVSVGLVLLSLAGGLLIGRRWLRT